MATPLTYRQWLQMKANDRSGEVPTDPVYANMLLQIVGDDGRLDANAVGENRKFTGSDGETYYTAGAEGDFANPSKGLMTVNDTMFARYNNYRSNPALIAQANQESEGYAGGGGFGGGGGGGVDPEAARRAEEERLRTQLRGDISNRGRDIDSIYNALFGDLETLIKSRDTELEKQYGDQLTQASEQYAGAIPDIENSYAALGAADSTDTADAKTGAKKGFDETTKTIGENKKADKAALGQYRSENRAKFDADRAAARRNVTRANETTDLDALRGMRNDLETNLDTAGVTRATLKPEGKAAKEISGLTKDAGRYEAAVNALDAILKSSMSGAVKEAAVTAVTDSAGLSDKEKKKIQETYGNVYAEQAAL